MKSTHGTFVTVVLAVGDEVAGVRGRDATIGVTQEFVRLTLSADRIAKAAVKQLESPACEVVVVRLKMESGRAILDNYVFVRT